MPVVSLKVDERTKQLMEMHDEINWSAVLRNSLENKLENMEHPVKNKAVAMEASKDIDKIRKSHRAMAPSEKIVREWRNKRK